METKEQAKVPPKSYWYMTYLCGFTGGQHVGCLTQASCYESEPDIVSARIHIGTQLQISPANVSLGNFLKINEQNFHGTAVLHASEKLKKEQAVMDAAMAAKAAAEAESKPALGPEKETGGDAEPKIDQGISEPTPAAAEVASPDQVPGDQGAEQGQSV